MFSQTVWSCMYFITLLVVVSVVPDMSITRAHSFPQSAKISCRAAEFVIFLF